MLNHYSKIENRRKQNMKINWKVRFKNPQFWVVIGVVFFVNLFAMSGISFEEVNSWGQLWDLVLNALKSPYTFVTLATFVYATAIDFTTSGISDSTKALAYIKPKKDEK